VTALFGDPVVAWLYQVLRTGFLACWGLAALWPPPQRLAAGDEAGRGPLVWPFALVVLLVPAALLTRAERAVDPREAVLAVAAPPRACSWSPGSGRRPGQPPPTR
jgi:hypothetical protein